MYVRWCVASDFYSKSMAAANYYVVLNVDVVAGGGRAWRHPLALASFGCARAFMWINCITAVSREGKNEPEPPLRPS